MLPARLAPIAALVAGIAATAPGLGELHAQSAPTGSAVTATSPEPIYWKQSLFQIPYQWGSAAEPGAAQLVLLYVSKDQGASWQKISEARPSVTSFNYRAEGEGEYWFAVRTLDHQGRAWPTGEFAPEIRVIVDTTMPQITSLHAAYRADGIIEIERTGFDVNLDSTTWRFEIQSQPTAPWQQVPHVERFVAATNPVDSAASAGANRVELQLPAGQIASAVRATVHDRAGNMATYHTNVLPAGIARAPVESTVTAASTSPPYTSWPGVPTTSPPVNNPFVQVAQPAPPSISTPGTPPVSTVAETLSPGWISSADAPVPANAQPAQPTDQPWPADATARVPFRLWSGGLTASQDAVTSYSNPVGIGPPPIGAANSNSYPNAIDNAPGPIATADSQPPAGAPSIQPLGPFRQASISRNPGSSEREQSIAGEPVSQFAGAQPAQPPRNDTMLQLPPGVQPKLVGSRRFVLEYEIDDAGGRGVSSVELWGTRDGGNTWRIYTRDDDNRSPLVVTVDEEGLFGFRIVVEGTEGPAPQPTTGDQPELWVAVDLQRPTTELTAIELGNGNMADHLILRWRAADDNLEARPISIFYSSHPVGPWSAIATSLENTGEYAWRVERHVPTRFYLRIEARDTAGNLAASQTRDPIEFSAPTVNGRLRSAEPIDPTATETSTSYR